MVVFFVVVFLCFCGGVVVFLWWCSFCDGVGVVMFLWWCWCGGVFAVALYRSVVGKCCREVL